MTSQYLTHAAWIAARSAISVAESPAVATVGVVALFGVAEGLVEDFETEVGVVAGVDGGGEVDRPGVGVGVGTGTDEVGLTAALDEPSDAALDEDRPDGRLTAEPPMPSTWLLVGGPFGVEVEVQPVTKMADRTAAAPARSHRERPCIPESLLSAIGRL